MRRAELVKRPSGRALLLVMVAASLALVACDNSVDFSPTPPVVPPFPPIGDRNLQISGSLSAGGGACFVATILFDGVELPGGRTDCPDADGCAKLDLAATTSAGAGTHTISFLVLGQSRGLVDYEARGKVVVTRGGLNFRGRTIYLEPRSASLRPGESVTYEVVFID